MGFQLDRVINENYSKLNNVDQHILNFVISNFDLCKTLSISELAKKCNVSTATVLRTTQKLDFSGFSEFKYFLRSDSQENQEVLNLIEILNQDIAQTIKFFLQNGQLQSICDMIEHAHNIYAYGTGQGQRLMLQEFSRCFLNVNKNIVLLATSTELKIAKKFMTSQDIVFIASLSGKIDSYRDILQSMHIMNIPMVSITNIHKNELSELSTYNLYFQSTNIDHETKLNRSSYLSLHLVLHLLYDQYINYINLKDSKTT